MSREHNFSAGPALLPESVVREAQGALWELEGSGMGVAELSHRGKAFDAVLVRARDRVRRLLQLSDDQEVLFLHGGASTQFYQVPMNLLNGGTAAYVDTGTWSSGAAKQARRYGYVDVVWSGSQSGYDHVPRQGEWGELPAELRYFHYTSNNTIRGTEYDYVPEIGSGWLVCDASSDILSRPMDGSKFDLLYAGAQKNLGPSGTTLVVIRRGLLEHIDTDIPDMLRYDIQVDKQSMLNTPCTFAIYVIERMLAWIEDQGGLSVIDARNQAQADKVYGVIDSTDFYKGMAQPGSRSRMNLTFSTGQADLDKAFVSEAEAAGLHGLKGHRSVGGLRASLYNAQRDESVDALCDFMADFVSRHG